MPVIVMKAAEGLCDRLQVLSHCFRYCELHGAALCVDWKDWVWGGGEYDFWDFFEIVGIKIMSKEMVLRLVASGRVDVRPKTWDLNKIASPFYAELLKDEYVGEFMNYTEHKCEGDVLVTNGAGKRIFDVSALSRYLRIKPNIAREVKRILTKSFLPSVPLVHLRGTDRPDGGFIENAINYFIKFPSPRIQLVSDMEELIQKFQDKHPHAHLVNPKAEVRKLPNTKARGSHQANPKELAAYGVRKRQMIIDLLADWVAIYSSDVAFGREESTYFMLARMFHDAVPISDSSKLLGWKMLEREGKLEWEEVDRACIPRNREEINTASKLTETKRFSRIIDQNQMPAPINETAVLPNRLQEEASKTTGGDVPVAQSVC
jgi:hypothetical protein